MRLINTEFIGNPINWLIVWLMLAFGVLALGLLRPITLTNPFKQGNT